MTGQGPWYANLTDAERVVEASVASASTMDAAISDQFASATLRELPVR